MVEKSGVEMYFNLRKMTFQPQTFNHELSTPMVQKFMVEKSWVERSGVEMFFNQIMD